MTPKLKGKGLLLTITSVKVHETEKKKKLSKNRYLNSVEERI